MKELDLEELKLFIREYSGNKLMDFNFSIINNHLEVKVITGNKVYCKKRDLSSDYIAEIESQILAIALELLEDKSLVE